MLKVKYAYTSRNKKKMPPEQWAQHPNPKPIPHLAGEQCLGLKSLHRGPPFTMAHLCLETYNAYNDMVYNRNRSIIHTIILVYVCNYKTNRPKEQQQWLTRLLLVKTYTRSIVWALICVYISVCLKNWIERARIVEEIWE